MFKNKIDMKRISYFFILWVILPLNARSQSEVSDSFFKQLMDDVVILSERGMIRGEKQVSGFVSDLISDSNGETTYSKTFNAAVNPNLVYEIGELLLNNQSYQVMFIKRKNNKQRQSIEFLVIYRNESPVTEHSALKVKRDMWMEFCNTHQAGALVRQLYTKEAYYYNRGRLLQGTKALSTEYSYMNSPSYSLQLTPKHIVFVSPQIAYEIGQCSGSYPYPYMLLWNKTKNGQWKIMMDSNY